MSSSQDSVDFNSEDYATPAEDLRERMIARFGHLERAQLLIFLRKYRLHSHGNMSVDRIIQELANIIEDFQNMMDEDRNPVEQVFPGEIGAENDDDDSQGEDDDSQREDDDSQGEGVVYIGEMGAENEIGRGALPDDADDDSVDFNSEDYATPAEVLRERMIARFGHLDRAQLLRFLTRYRPHFHGNMSVHRILQELGNIIEDFQNPVE